MDATTLMKTVLDALESTLKLKENGMHVTVLLTVPRPEGGTGVNYGSTANRDDMAKAIQEIAARFQPRVRHLKRGSEYAVIGEASVQASSDIAEGDRVMVYRGLTTDQLYVRPVTEFNDGRFEKLPK